jgi:hypothetical protein
MKSQKSFGDFTRERFGPNWVYAHHSTPRIRAQYDKPDCPVVVITPKQQQKLRADYKIEWGRENDLELWTAICALRDIVKLNATYSEIASKALRDMGVRPW